VDFNMTPIDWVIMIVLAVAAVAGLAQGFVRSIFGLIGLVVGLQFAFRHYAHAAAKLTPLVHSEPVANAIAFIGIAIVVMALAALVGHVLAKLFRIIGLGWLDMLAGAVLGFFEGVLLISVCILATVAFFPQAPWLTESRTPQLFVRACEMTLNLSPAKFAERVHEGIEKLK
jgi:membrane protein required for colicin V production